MRDPLRARPRFRSSGTRLGNSSRGPAKAEEAPHSEAPGGLVPQGPPCPIPQGQSHHGLQIPALAQQAQLPGPEDSLSSPHGQGRAWHVLPGPLALPSPQARTEATGMQRPRDIPSPGVWGLGTSLHGRQPGPGGSPQTPAQGRQRCPAGKPREVSPPSSGRGSRPPRAPAMSGSKPPGTRPPPAPARLQPTLCPEQAASLQPGTRLCPQPRGRTPHT